MQSVLIANRGEIACRIARTCKRMGIRSIAVYSDADRDALHVQACDEALRIGPGPVRDSYLCAEAILEAARRSGAQAIHPGYGLLSEQAQFARAVTEAGLVFVGPPASALELCGDKAAARAIAQQAGAPVAPGSKPMLPDDPDLVAAAEAVGFPVLVKCVGGGGGIGMQVAREPGALAGAVRYCAARGQSAFGDGRAYFEKLVAEPRHIEVQVVCDPDGTCVALPERECSVQRRHQKLIEETPAAARFLDGPDGARLRGELMDAALRVVRAAGYRNVGTVEFLADEQGHLHFLEVNARLQVEHTVTEAITGVDLVELQLRIASGESVTRQVEQVAVRGHAIQARLCAEDPARNFVPQPSRVQRLCWPGQQHVRVDAGIQEGSEISPLYDSLMAKVIAWGEDRKQARERLIEALTDTTIELQGPRGPAATNVSFLKQVLQSEQFASGDYSTSLVEQLRRA